MFLIFGDLADFQNLLRRIDCFVFLNEKLWSKYGLILAPLHKLSID